MERERGDEGHLISYEQNHFVHPQVCDGSVLIDSTANNTTEKDAPPTNPSLHGFEAIDATKSSVEAQYPSIVSCTDILPFAACDSAALTVNITYSVPSGRRNGNISIASVATANLPTPNFNASQLIANFTAKNITADDMVTLASAHTIGVAHCSTFTNLINNFSTSSTVDPTLIPAYASLLQSWCLTNAMTAENITTGLDLISPTVMNNKNYVGVQLTLKLLTSVFIIWVLVVAFSSPLASTFVPPRQLSWAGTMVALQERIVEEEG